MKAYDHAEIYFNVSFMGMHVTHLILNTGGLTTKFFTTVTVSKM
jgi:hypothetical protein